MERLTIQLQENLLRKDISPVDEATRYLSFYRMATGDETVTPKGMSRDITIAELSPDKAGTDKLSVLEAIRKISGKSMKYVFRLESVLTLPENAIEAVRNGKLNKTAPWFRILSP